MAETVTDSSVKNNWAGRHRRALLISMPALLLLIILWYLLTGRTVSTDDAYIQAGQVKVSSNLTGQIVEIGVHDNQKVKTGDVLFKLDDRPFRIAVEDAEAQLSNAQLQIQALKATYQQRVADQQAANDALTYQQREYARQQKLAAEGITSKSQLDKTHNALNQAISDAAAAQQQTATVLHDLGGSVDISIDQHPRVKQAQAMLDRAKLNLSYTVIRASIDGIVTKVNQLQVGNYINASEPQFALISDKDIWVEANFKEDQLTHVRPGQSATFVVDTYPGMKFTGKVVSISPGTGSSFSLLPPENASGNWVKVVQRIPVRISIDKPPANILLAAGMSVTAEIDTQHYRWQRWK